MLIVLKASTKQLSFIPVAVPNREKTLIACFGLRMLCVYVNLDVKFPLMFPSVESDSLYGIFFT